MHNPVCSQLHNRLRTDAHNGVRDPGRNNVASEGHIIALRRHKVTIKRNIITHRRQKVAAGTLAPPADSTRAPLGAVCSACTEVFCYRLSFWTLSERIYRGCAPGSGDRYRLPEPAASKRQIPPRCASPCTSPSTPGDRPMHVPGSEVRSGRSASIEQARLTCTGFDPGRGWSRAATTDLSILSYSHWALRSQADTDTRLAGDFVSSGQASYGRSSACPLCDFATSRAATKPSTAATLMYDAAIDSAKGKPNSPLAGRLYIGTLGTGSGPDGGTT